MKYHLDTSTVIDVLKFHRESLLNFELTPIQDIAISSIVAHELWQGAAEVDSGSRSRKLLLRFMDAIEVIPFGLKEAETSGSISSYLSKVGKSIGYLDPFIAGHAITQSATLVTRNTKHFRLVPGLQIVDWSKHAE